MESSACGQFGLDEAPRKAAANSIRHQMARQGDRHRGNDADSAGPRVPRDTSGRNKTELPIRPPTVAAQPASQPVFTETGAPPIATCTNIDIPYCGLPQIFEKGSGVPGGSLDSAEYRDSTDTAQVLSLQANYAI